MEGVATAKLWRICEGATTVKKWVLFKSAAIHLCSKIGILQLFACMEVIHATTGLIRTGILVSLMQWAGRSHVLFAIIHQVKEIQGSFYVYIVFIAWSLSEVPGIQEKHPCMELLLRAYTNVPTHFLIQYRSALVQASLRDPSQLHKLATYGCRPHTTRIIRGASTVPTASAPRATQTGEKMDGDKVIRYPQYALYIIGACPTWLTWLRYTAFIPLYPLGVLGEVAAMYFALPFIQRDDLHGNIFKLLPFRYHSFVIVLLVIYPMLWLPLYMHMLNRRNIKLTNSSMKKKTTMKTY